MKNKWMEDKWNPKINANIEIWRDEGVNKLYKEMNKPVTKQKTWNRPDT